MEPDKIIPANFTFSSNALATLASLRAEHDASEDDKFFCWSVYWGRVDLRSGPSFESVVVGIYGESARYDIEPYIQRVSGVDLFYFVTPENYPKLEGMVIDIEPGEGFYARPPSA